MTGMCESDRGRGHPKTRGIDVVIGSTKLSLFDLCRDVDDRMGWRGYVMGVTRGPPQSDGTGNTVTNFAAFNYCDEIIATPVLDIDRRKKCQKINTSH